MNTKVFVTRSATIGYNFNQISHVAHFFFVVRHKLACVPNTFVIFSIHLVSIDCHIDSFLHFIGYDYPDKCTTDTFFGLGWRMQQFPAGWSKDIFWNGGISSSTSRKGPWQAGEPRVVLEK